MVGSGNVVDVPILEGDSAKDYRFECSSKFTGKKEHAEGIALQWENSSEHPIEMANSSSLTKKPESAWISFTDDDDDIIQRLIFTSGIPLNISGDFICRTSLAEGVAFVNGAVPKPAKIRINGDAFE